MEELQSELVRLGIIVKDWQRRAFMDNYLRHRMQVSIFWSVITFAAAIYIGMRWSCHGAFPTYRGGILLGMAGLTVRSWSFLNQPESPFPPYVLTYPLIIFLGCPFITATAYLNSASHPDLIPYLIAGPCFILGYGPMNFLGRIK